jgi:hypothetical protein
MKTLRCNIARIALLVAAAVIPACGTTAPSLRVNTAPPPLGTYKSVKIVCTAEEEKAQPYTGRLETQVMVKLKERDTFQDYRLSKDADPTDLVVNVKILDLKKASAVSVGWYTRNTSKVNCDVDMVDPKTNASIGNISVVARPRYSSIEQAIDDAAVQIADYLREHK